MDHLQTEVTLAKTLARESSASGEAEALYLQALLAKPGNLVASSETTSLDATVCGATFATRRFAEKPVRDALLAAGMQCVESVFWTGLDTIVVRKAR
jgi:hypothetical protein